MKNDFLKYIIKNLDRDNYILREIDFDYLTTKDDLLKILIKIGFEKYIHRYCIAYNNIVYKIKLNKTNVRMEISAYLNHSYSSFTYKNSKEYHDLGNKVDKNNAVTCEEFVNKEFINILRKIKIKSLLCHL